MSFNFIPYHILFPINKYKSCLLQNVRKSKNESEKFVVQIIHVIKFFPLLILCLDIFFNVQDTQKWNKWRLKIHVTFFLVKLIDLKSVFILFYIPTRFLYNHSMWIRWSDQIVGIVHDNVDDDDGTLNSICQLQFFYFLIFLCDVHSNVISNEKFIFFWNENCNHYCY